MNKNKFFWSYFSSTGRIGAYLLFKNLIGETDDYAGKLRFKRKLG
ncbi:MAG: YqzL family protein [Clostridia bacterium]|jgi:hypothetical protein|nr:YqzL family protein [Clostridia bacterium]